MYLGRFQQGAELPLVLQCTDVDDTPDDPADCPTAEIYTDEAAPTLIHSVRLAADLRGVATGIFRRPVFLDTLYSTEGRYLVVFKWQDSNGIAHVLPAAFHILPGGSEDGALIAMYHMLRPDAAYLVAQCDSGRLIRKRNPR